MIYVDSSALLKLLVEEQESAALQAWLTDRAGTPVVSSALAQVEVLRACRRLDPALVPAASALIAGLDLIPLAQDLLTRAATAGTPALRSLDAIHLASALSLTPHLTAFVAYDLRLLEAASAAGLPCLTPG